MRTTRVLATASTLLLLIGVAHFVGIVTESEYPHWWVLAKVRSARTESGLPVREVLERSFGASVEQIQWHTCSYAEHSHVAPGETHVQFNDPREATRRYEFIYIRAANTLRAANDEAAHLLESPRG